MKLSAGGLRVRSPLTRQIARTGGADSPYSKTEGVKLEDTLYRFLEQEPELKQKQELRLKITDFKLAGLGEAGESCGKLVMTDVDIGENEDDIKAVRFKPLRCSRIECPQCYYEWAIRQTFSITLKIEAMAEIREERPFHVVFSVHPIVCYGMTWTDINQKIWRRGRRRLTYIRCENAEKSGHTIKDCPDCLDLDVDQFGATGIFHPFRIRRKWVEKLGGSEDEEFDGNARLWKKIRERLLNGQGSLANYVKIGYHAHNLLFTDFPEKQTNEEYVIKFAGNFERLSRKRVVALVRYLITHTATITETAIYRNHVCLHCGHSYGTNKYRCSHCGRHKIEETHVKRNRIVHPIRSFGLLHNFDPKAALIEHFGKEEGLKIYHRLAHEIANLLILRTEKGEKVTMEWNEEEEELTYPAYAEEFITSDEKSNWVSIYKLIELLEDSEFRSSLPVEQLNFADSVVSYIYEEGIPPPIEACGRDLFTCEICIPDAVVVVIPEVEAEDRDVSLERSRLTRPRKAKEPVGVGELRRHIIRLLQLGEQDVNRLDMCLPDYSFGNILRVLDWMAERGEVIRFGEEVRLNLYSRRKVGQMEIEEYPIR